MKRGHGIGGRLAHLERRTPSGSTVESREHMAHFMMTYAIIAVLRGSMGPRDDIYKGHAQAMGFVSEYASSTAMRENWDEWIRRHARLWDDICAEHNLHEDASPGEVIAFYERMAAGSDVLRAELRTARFTIAAAQPGTAAPPARSRPH